MPRIEVSADQHNLIAQRRIATRDLGDDVVAVAVLLEVARPQFDAQRHRTSFRGQSCDHVVLLTSHDDRGDRVGGRGASAGDTDGAVAVRARPQCDGDSHFLEQLCQIVDRW